MEQVLYCAMYFCCGVVILRGGCCYFGCCTRPRLRRQVGPIKGTCAQDMAIHCCAHFCALCQELREIDRWVSVHGDEPAPALPGYVPHSGQPLMPVATMAPPRSEEEPQSAGDGGLREGLLSDQGGSGSDRP